MLTNFFAAIDRLGSTNDERAKRLQMSARSLEKWKSGKIPRILRILASDPELLSAIAADAQNSSKKSP